MNTYYHAAGGRLEMRLTVPLGRLGIWRLCLTRNLRLRRSQYREASPEVLSIKKALRIERGDRCEMCGRAFGKDVFAQVHHVLPWARFPEYREDRRNMRLLCAQCHEGLHRDPFRLVDDMQAKAAELGVGDVRHAFANPPYEETKSN